MSNINFEADQREDLDSVNDAKSLSDQVVKLKELEDDLEKKEKELKELKRHIDLVSGEVIPTMMQEMNIFILLMIGKILILHLVLPFMMVLGLSVMMTWLAAKSAGVIVSSLRSQIILIPLFMFNLVLVLLVFLCLM